LGETEVIRFEEYYRIGSRPRLALALLLYTAQRRSDVVGMGRQHLHGDMLSIRQVKTGEPLMIPVHPRLAKHWRGCRARK
jgi:integrase